MPGIEATCWACHRAAQHCCTALLLPAFQPTAGRLVPNPTPAPPQGPLRSALEAAALLPAHQVDAGQAQWLPRQPDAGVWQGLLRGSAAGRQAAATLGLCTCQPLAASRAALQPMQDSTRR